MQSHLENDMRPPASTNSQPAREPEPCIKQSPQPGHGTSPRLPARPIPGTAGAGRNPDCRASPGAAPTRLDGTAALLRPGTHTTSAAPSAPEPADADKSLPRLLRSEYAEPSREISPW